MYPLFVKPLVYRRQTWAATIIISTSCTYQLKLFYQLPRNYTSGITRAWLVTEARVYVDSVCDWRYTWSYASPSTPQGKRHTSGQTYLRSIHSTRSLRCGAVQVLRLSYTCRFWVRLLVFTPYREATFATYIPGSGAPEFRPVRALLLLQYPDSQQPVPFIVGSANSVSTVLTVYVFHPLACRISCTPLRHIEVLVFDYIT